jgi:phospholipase/lecithinase/hemolysin
MAFALDEAVNDVIVEPASHGINNVTDACLSNQLLACNDSDSYLFWDPLHPTTEAQSYLEQRMYELVAESPATSDVPGPLPALGGLAALAWSRRLRRRVLSASATQTAGMVNAPHTVFA